MPIRFSRKALGSAIVASVALAIGLAAPTYAAPASTNTDWLIGQWTLAEDEDGGRPGMDLDEFFQDGRYIIYGPNCREPPPGSWHMYRGDVYVSLDVPGKGPIALVFRPNAEHTELTYTSPRTRNNAIYRRALPNPCSRIEK